MTRALFDTNVILDALLDRQPWSTDAKALWQAQGQVSVFKRQSANNGFQLIRRFLQTVAANNLEIFLTFSNFPVIKFLDY